MAGAGNQFDAVTLGTTTAGVDVSATDAGDALVAALASDPVGVVTGANSTGTVTLTAKDFGAAANAYTTTEAMANGAFGGGTLSGGATAENGVIRIELTNATAETVSLRLGSPPVGGIPIDASVPIQVTHA